MVYPWNNVFYYYYYYFFLSLFIYFLKLGRELGSCWKLHLCEKWGLFPGMTEWVDLPTNLGAATFTKVVFEEGKAGGVLVYDSRVVCRGLIVHTPASQNKLQTTCQNAKTLVTKSARLPKLVLVNVDRINCWNQLIEWILLNNLWSGDIAIMMKFITCVDEAFDYVSGGIILLFPPPREKCHFHVDEASVLVFLQFIHHIVYDVLNLRVLNGIVGCKSCATCCQRQTSLLQ